MHSLIKRLLSSPGANDLLRLVRLGVMVGFLEEHVLEVERFAGDVDRQDLARSVARQFVAERKSRDQHRAAVGPVAFAQKVRLRLELSHFVRQGENRLSVLLGQRVMRLELAH